MLSNEDKQIYNRLKEISIVKSLRGGMLAGHICRILSPFCSVWFIKHKVIPNKITILMIIFGVVGSIFFMLPFGWSKIVGYLFWFLWFTMDLSDGEVARYTKHFSKYGTEIDYMAHLIDHPFMNIALWLTFLSFNIIDTFTVSLLFIATISVELVMRHIIAFQHYHENNRAANYAQVSYLKYFATQILLYPNLIIIFTPFIILDFYLHIGFSLYIYLVWFIYALLIFIRTVIKQLRIFYRG